MKKPLLVRDRDRTILSPLRPFRLLNRGVERRGRAAVAQVLEPDESVRAAMPCAQRFLVYWRSYFLALTNKRLICFRTKMLSGRAKKLEWALPHEAIRSATLDSHVGDDGMRDLTIGLPDGKTFWVGVNWAYVVEARELSNRLGREDAAT